MFDTFYGRYLIYYIIMTSNLSFHDFLQTFLYPVKNASVRKKANIFLNFIVLFYRCLVKTTLLQVFFTLNKYKSNFLKGEFQWLPHPQKFNLKKGQYFQS